MLVPRRTQPNRVPRRVCNGHFFLCYCSCRRHTLLTKTSRSGSEFSDLKDIPTFSTCDGILFDAGHQQPEGQLPTAATASCSTLGGRKANATPSGSSKADVSTNTHQKESRTTHGVPKSHHTQRQGLLFNSPLNKNTCFGFLQFLPGGTLHGLLGSYAGFCLFFCFLLTSAISGSTLVHRQAFLFSFSSIGP